MSVIHFGPGDLANVASVAIGNYASDDGKRALDRAIGALALYSAENARAYGESYQADGAQGWTAEQIRGYVRPSANVSQLRDACSTIELLRYNLIANNGADFASAETLSALLSLALGIARRTRRNLEPARVAG